MTDIQINQLITLFVISYLICLFAGLRVYFLTIEIAEYKKMNRLKYFEYFYLIASIIPLININMFILWLQNGDLIKDFKFSKKNGLYYKTDMEREYS